MSRSRNGCYTCRIRKKKCDEKRPICMNCSSRGIECHGFGPRPRWMLGVSRDAEEFREIRRAAAETYQARRNPWSDLSLSSRAIGNGNGEKDEKTLEGTSGEPSSRRGGADEAEMAMSDVRPWQDDVDNMMIPSGWHSSLSVRGHSQIPINSNAISTSSTFAASTPHALLPVVSNPAMDSIWWHSGLQAHTYNIRSTAELAMVSHYLNEVFPIIHEFHQSSSSSPEQGRAWVLSLLLRSTPMYWACLSLSTCHRILITDGQSKPGSKDARLLHQQCAITLKILQSRLAEVPKLTGIELLTTGFELLGCMIEVTSLEIFRDIEGLYISHWEIHMSGIRSLLATITTDPILKSKLHDPTTPTQLDTIEALLSHAQPHRLSLLSSSDVDAFNYFITCFVWADILSQALDILPPSPAHQTTFRYTPLLEHGTLNTSKVMGAENWAMVSIYYTNILRDWKRDSVATNHLDVLELEARASVISIRLQTSLAAHILARQDLKSRQLDSSLVTEAFALACFVYLSVTVHGAHPSHPAVRQAFTRSLDSLLALPSRLLVRVAWPFVVTGCMALEGGEQVLLRGIVRRAAGKGEPCGTAVKALRVMKGCWAAREEAAGGGREQEAGYGWVEGMKRLGSRVLVI